LPQYTFRTDTQTERPTDGLGDRSVRRVLTLYYIDREQRANKHFNPFEQFTTIKK